MIEVKNVTKKYGDFYAVRNINFEIEEGEIVGFLGRNGAGKSTTMNMITGFIEPTSGQIIVDGYDIDKKPKKVKRQIGYMPEGTPLYSELTVKEFVGYMADLKMIPRKEKKAAVEKAIKSTGLDKVQNNLTKILSRGYKQRVSLAGAIVGDPKILILDEPTVGLDPKQVIEIRELIKSFRKDHTVILSSHILSEISQICEKIIIIDKGEIVAVDTPENLEKKSAKDQVIDVVVEETEECKLTEIKEKIEDVKDVYFVKENDDGGMEYKITVQNGKDIRKEISTTCAKMNIIILEMKKQEVSLEDAFIELVEGRPEYSQKELKKIQYQKDIEDLRQEKEEKKEKKQAKKEEKAAKKAEKQAKKEEEKNQKDSSEETAESQVAEEKQEVEEEAIENNQKNEENKSENKEEKKEESTENVETEENKKKSEKDSDDEKSNDSVSEDDKKEDKGGEK